MTFNQLIIRFSIFLLIFFCDQANAQQQLNAIQRTDNGVQSSILIEPNNGTFVFQNNPHQVESDENGIPHPQLTQSGDFDGDGITETAMFFDYSYYPNNNSKFTTSKIVIYKHIDNQMVPVGVWFSRLKSTFSFDVIKFSVASDFNGDGKCDLVLFSNVPNFDQQIVYVFTSNAKAFDDPAVFYSTNRNEFNFDAIKFCVASDFTGDGVSDLALFYNYFGDNSSTPQRIFVLESKKNSFAPPVVFFNSTKASTNFSNYKSAHAVDLKGNGQTSILCIDDDLTSDLQQIISFEISDKTTFSQSAIKSINRNDFNFFRAKHIVAGDYNGDSKTDLAVAYDNIGRNTQNIFVFESTGTSFTDFKQYFSAPKSTFSFDNISSMFSGKFDAKPTVTPTIWYNNKKAAVTFGFDDGLSNGLRYGATALSKEGLNGTFYIISNLPYDQEVDYCSWDTLRYYANKGHEMASHSANHRAIGKYTGADSLLLLQNLLLKSKTDLDRELNQNTISMSYPFGNFNAQSANIVSSYFLNGRSSQSGYNLATPFDAHVMKSLCVVSTTPNASVRSMFQTAETYGYHLSLMYHNIQPADFDKNADEYSFALSDFIENIKAAKSFDLWIDTQGNVFKYIQSRNALKVTKIEQFLDSIHLQVEDYLDNQIYNQKITLRVLLPNHWGNTNLYSNTSDVVLPVFTEGSEKYCFVNVLPNNALVKLYKDKPSALKQNSYNENFRLQTNKFDKSIVIEGAFVSGMQLELYNSGGQKTHAFFNLQSNIVKINAPQSLFYVAVLRDSKGLIICRSKIQF